MQQARFVSSCVDWPMSDVDSLINLQNNSIPVSLATFKKHAHPGDFLMIQKKLGYSIGTERGLRIANDRHVTYHRGKLNGTRAYYLRWSAIEYVFQ